MNAYLIKEASIINEGKIIEADILIKEGRIERIDPSVSAKGKISETDAGGKHILPGVIDDQVHFREPGLTHKADIYTESRAAVAGGITSFMEMPNTNPPALTQQLLEQKYRLAEQRSLANYSFYMGASNDNLREVLKTDIQNVCGIKVFMGSSTGNMLVDDASVLEGIFSQSPMLVATHCEDEETIRNNMALYREKYGEDVPMECHPLIRSEEACYKSSSLAVALAKKYNTRLHILHISTAKETALFDHKTPLEKKRITAEACVHHLWFDDSYYKEKGTLIKWNPAVKTAKDKAAVLQSVLDNRIDVIATDHAPHTLEEKQNTYFKAPSGGPLVQHSLVAMLELYHQGKIALERVVEKMCHAPAICFQVAERGFVREGFWADLALVDLNDPWTVKKENLLYKCKWSPFEGQTFHSKVLKTFVSGKLVYDEGKLIEAGAGQRLKFVR